MITATHDIILLNGVTDGESRRNLYVATQISGVSFAHKRKSNGNGNFREDEAEYRIRIPVDADIQNGKAYAPEALYHRMEDEDAKKRWTIRTEDLLIVCSEPLADVNVPVFESDSVTEQDVRAMADAIGLLREPIRIVDYSDNTLRGGEATRHWRIGGA